MESNYKTCDKCRRLYNSACNDYCPTCGDDPKEKNRSDYKTCEKCGRLHHVIWNDDCPTCGSEDGSR
jgi:RNA polymerase subunit RPABC4/transcription elongation factor Spt4